MSQELPFDPCPFLQGPHKQTIMGSLCNFLFEPPSDQKIVTLPDGDKISLEVTTPRGWKGTDPTVVMVHGLCGSHKSPYLIRMAKRLEELGIRAVRFNMRGCGSGKGLAKKIYHAGRSDDVFEVLKTLKKENPDSKIVLIGFSLGANVVLKLAGELHNLYGHFLNSVIAVCPPVDLFSSVQRLGLEENGVYERYFYKLLRAEVHYLYKKFRDLPRVRLPRDLKLYEFDQIYTAPISGFHSAQDYYDRCSALPVVGEIDLPCKILLSQDDPIISHSSLDAAILPKNVEVFKTKNGGHMGYLGDPWADKGVYWLDSILIDWTKEFLSHG